MFLTRAVVSILRPKYDQLSVHPRACEHIAVKAGATRRFLHRPVRMGFFTLPILNKDAAVRSKVVKFRWL